MLLRIIAVLSLIATLGFSAFAQSTGGIQIDSDLRVFTTVAALNVAGFDVELGAQYHPVRAAVRKFSEGLDPDLVRRLKDYYVRHKGRDADESQLAKYISLALVLTDPPEFKPLFREEQLPPDAREVVDFAFLLTEFYQKAKISQRWVELRPEYDREMDQLGPDLRDAILRTDAYLRNPMGGPGTRNLVVDIELAAPINSVNVRSNQDTYYIVMGASPTPKVDEVRHAYLHFKLDAYVAGAVPKLESGNSLLGLIGLLTDVNQTYAHDFWSMVSESLIRAVEIRVDRTPAARAQETMNGYYRNGLLLVPYFYEALQDYEKAGVPLVDQLGQIAEGFDLKKERVRFEQTFAAIPSPPRPVVHAEVPIAPKVDPVRDLLRQAQQAFNGGDDEKALLGFQDVLTRFDPTNGAALYGIGLVASRLGDSEHAMEYFDRTTKSASADSGSKAWAFIFMGRIADLDCERSKAMAYYQQSVQLGDNTRNAQSIAAEGLAKPYGDACRQ